MKQGISLIDVALAILVSSVMLSSTMALVVGAQQKRREAQLLGAATALAQAVMTPLAANPALKPLQKKTDYGPEYGIYSGYKVTVLVSQQKIDPARVFAGGSIKGPPIADELPPDAANRTPGKTADPKAGLEMNMLRIIVTVKYPLGRKEYGTLQVQTFRGSKI